MAVVRYEELNGGHMMHDAQNQEMIKCLPILLAHTVPTPPTTDPKYADWRADGAQIRSGLWNSTKSCSLAFWPTAKHV